MMKEDIGKEGEEDEDENRKRREEQSWQKSG